MFVEIIVTLKFAKQAIDIPSPGPFDSIFNVFDNGSDLLIVKYYSILTVLLVLSIVHVTLFNAMFSSLTYL